MLRSPLVLFVATFVSVNGLSVSGGVAKRKVVVTGLGALTSLGNDVDTMFQNVIDGKCGIGPVTAFDTEHSAVKIASEVKDFDVKDFWDPKDAKRYDRYSHLAMGAAKTALADGGLIRMLSTQSASAC